MTSASETCLNCRQSFYPQFLHPLKLEEFSFASHQILSLACFVASKKNPDCPKVCNTCFALLNDSHIVSKRTVLDNVSHKLPTYVCATCCQLSPSNNLMNMRLTVVKFDGREINLVECVMVCMEKTFRADVNLMICLACLSVIAAEYVQRAEKKFKSETEGVPELIAVKAEPLTEIIDDDRNLETHVKSETEDDDGSSIIHQLSTVFTKSIVKTSAKVPTVPKTNQERETYSCAFCQILLTSKSKLTIHMKTHRSDYGIRKFECHHCPKWSRTKRQLRIHLETQHFRKTAPPRKYPQFQTCIFCSTTFYNRNEYKKHMRSHHEKEKLECKVCKTTFPRFRSYTRHMLAQKDVFNCTKCEMAFHKPTRLDKHMEKIHNQCYQCEICNLPLFTRKTFRIHQLTQHGITSKLRCKECGGNFETKHKLAEHRTLVHKPTKSLICDQCGMAFHAESHLKNHLTTHRDYEKPNCHLCSRKHFRNPETLAKHIQSAHMRAKTQSTVTKYACTVCPLRFIKRQHLEGHMIVHNTDNRPFFQCNQCGIAYTRRQKLQVHATKCPMSN